MTAFITSISTYSSPLGHAGMVKVPVDPVFTVCAQGPTLKIWTFSFFDSSMIRNLIGRIRDLPIDCFWPIALSATSERGTFGNALSMMLEGIFSPLETGYLKLPRGRFDCSRSASRKPQATCILKIAEGFLRLDSSSDVRGPDT